MRKILLLCLLIGLVILVVPVNAQSATATPVTTTTTTTTESTISYFFVACETQVILDLEGNMQPGDDIYVQVFRETGASGTQLSNIIRVSVNNAYQVSQTVTFPSGQTLLLGQFASARVSIGRESDSSNTSFTTVVEDVQDGCVTPSFPSADTSDLGSGASGPTTPIIDPLTGQVIDLATGDATIAGSSGIFTPDGGVLNDIIVRSPEAVVQIGARPSAQVQFTGRTSDPGLIFAECDMFPGANPGLLWDTDNLTVFWSWFARTPALVQEHIDNAQYEVFLTSPYAYRQTFPEIQRSGIVRREDGNYWVFYVANLGDGFRPGQYRIDYYVTWAQAISDGYSAFGPGTETEGLLSTCTFNIEPNPFGTQVERNNPTVPLQQNN
jgi:hypothetical protein